MKIRATIFWEYEIEDSRLLECYGTDDHQKCLDIDKNQYSQMLWDEIIPDNAVLKLEEL